MHACVIVCAIQAGVPGHPLLHLPFDLGTPKDPRCPEGVPPHSPHPTPPLFDFFPDLQTSPASTQNSHCLYPGRDTWLLAMGATGTPVQGTCSMALPGGHPLGTAPKCFSFPLSRDRHTSTPTAATQTGKPLLARGPAQWCLVDTLGTASKSFFFFLFLFFKLQTYRPPLPQLLPGWGHPAAGQGPPGTPPLSGAALWTRPGYCTQTQKQ